MIMLKNITQILAALFILVFSFAAFAATYTYDELNRLTSVNYRSGKKVSYSYDAGGNILSTAVPQPPTVTTTAPATGIAPTEATIAGVVTVDGSTAITERGVVYSTAVNPTTANGKVVVAGATGTFSATLTGLVSSTTYHARAYAINTQGTAYGEDLQFSTLAVRYTVTASGGSGGTVLPVGGQTIDYNATAVIALTPNTGYHVDTAAVSSTCPRGSFSGIGNTTYTSGAITGNCTVILAFAADPINGSCGGASGSSYFSAPITNLCDHGTPSVIPSGNGPWSWTCSGSGGGTTSPICTSTVTTWAIIASTPGGNGSISCTTPVNHGGQASCDIAAVDGYTLSTLTDNRTTVTESVINGRYTINGVTHNHNVSATFRDVKPPTLDLSTLRDNSYTKLDTLNVSGSVSDNGGIKSLTVNGQNVSVQNDGSFTTAVPLNPGANTIVTVATDLADNQTSITRTITLDLTAPVITITAPADNSAVNTPLLTVAGTVDDPTALVNIMQNNDTPQVAIRVNTAFSAGLTLVPGTNTIEATATDLAGNSSSLKRTVTYDDQQPSLAIISPASDFTTDQATITVTGTVSDPMTSVTVTVTVDGQSYTPALNGDTFTQPITFNSAKTYAINVTATNAAGTKISVIRNVIYQPVTAVTIQTNPVGRSFSVDGTPCTSSQSFTWTPGSIHTIAVTSPQVTGGTRYTFAKWSDTGAMSHLITAPAAPATYTATFTTEYQLTTAVSQAGAGTVSPVTGGWYVAGTMVPVKAFPNTGFKFVNWIGPVDSTGLVATTVIMSGPQSVTANLTGTPILSAAFNVKSGVLDARIWSITVTNSGTSVAAGARITGLTLVLTAGTTCLPVISPSQFPVLLGDIASINGAATGSVIVNMSSCGATAKFLATITYSANNGAVTGSKNYGSQTR